MQTAGETLPAMSRRPAHRARPKVERSAVPVPLLAGWKAVPRPGPAPRHLGVGHDAMVDGSP